MKKLILLVALFALPYFSFAQTDTTALANNTSYVPAEKYCVVNPTRGLFATKISLEVDYGQDPTGDNRLRDTNGKEIKFNSLADALNYMANQGWVFVNAFQADGSTFRYLLRRPAPRPVIIAGSSR